MLNMSIDNNTDSLPFLLYMQAQEQKEKEKDSGDEKQNTIWRADRPPLAHNRDWKNIYPELYRPTLERGCYILTISFFICPILSKNFGHFRKTAYSCFLYIHEEQKKGYIKHYEANRNTIQRLLLSR